MSNQDLKFSTLPYATYVDGSRLRPRLPHAAGAAGAAQPRPLRHHLRRRAGEEQDQALRGQGHPGGQEQVSNVSRHAKNKGDYRYVALILCHLCSCLCRVFQELLYGISTGFGSPQVRKEQRATFFFHVSAKYDIEKIRVLQN